MYKVLHACYLLISLFNRNSFRDLILLPDSISFLSLLSINTFKPMMQKANFHENVGRGSENLEGGLGPTLSCLQSGKMINQLQNLTSGFLNLIYCMAFALEISGISSRRN